MTSPFWAAFLWCVLILASVPLARDLQDLVRATLGRQAYLWVVLATLLVATGWGARAAWRRMGSTLWRRLPWLLVSAGACAGYTWHLRHAPEEALHFVEYGVLGLLLFRALRGSLPDRAVFPAALLLGSAAGLVDESVQWLVPGRFFDLRDLFVNALAVALGLVAVAGTGRPTELARPMSVRSLRRLCAITAALLLMLGLALSNTPPRMMGLIRVVPALGYLVDYGAVMTEYGHLHQLPDAGGLYSRLRLEELQAQDRARAPQVARVLDGYPSRDDYKLFLRDYPPFGDPFVHELRVHLFRRDRYLQRLAGERPPASERRRMATVAWREEQLLQACCAATLAASSYALPPETLEPLEPWIDREEPYTSAVSSHLIVRFRPWQAWLAIGLLWLLLAWIASRPTSPRRPPTP